MEVRAVAVYQLVLKIEAASRGVVSPTAGVVPIGVAAAREGVHETFRLVFADVQRIQVTVISLEHAQDFYTATTACDLGGCLRGIGLEMIDEDLVVYIGAYDGIVQSSSSLKTSSPSSWR